MSDLTQRPDETREEYNKRIRAIVDAQNAPYQVDIHQAALHKKERNRERQRRYRAGTKSKDFVYEHGIKVWSEESAPDGSTIKHKSHIKAGPDGQGGELAEYFWSEITDPFEWKIVERTIPGGEQTWSIIRGRKQCKYYPSLGNAIPQARIIFNSPRKVSADKWLLSHFKWACENAPDRLEVEIRGTTGLDEVFMDHLMKSIPLLYSDRVSQFLGVIKHLEDMAGREVRRARGLKDSANRRSKRAKIVVYDDQGNKSFLPAQTYLKRATENSRRRSMEDIEKMRSEKGS